MSDQFNKPDKSSPAPDFTDPAKANIAQIEDLGNQAKAKLKETKDPESWFRRAAYLAAILALGSIAFAAYRAAAMFDKAADAIESVKKPAASADALISTVNTTVAEAKPKVMNTLESISEAADNGKGAMVNLKSASNSLKTAADKSQVFYDEQLVFLRSEAVQRTAKEVLVGAREFSALMLNANLSARDFRLKTQPDIDKLIDNVNITVEESNKLIIRPSVPQLLDNSAFFVDQLGKSAEIANKRLPVMFDNAEKFTFHGAGIAESVDIIGKRVTAKKSKTERVLGFFFEGVIKSTPALFGQLRF